MHHLIAPDSTDEGYHSKLDTIIHERGLRRAIGEYLSSRRELTMTMLSLVAVSQATLEKGSALRQASRTASET